MNTFLYCLAYFGALTFFVVVAFLAGWKACLEIQAKMVNNGLVVFKDKAGKWRGRLMSLAEIAAQVGIETTDHTEANAVTAKIKIVSEDKYKPLMPEGFERFSADESEQVSR